MGSTGAFVMYWTLASVLAIICWNVVKYVVTRASHIMAASMSAKSNEAAAAASRPLIDVM